jgi:hypothetical protein
MNFLNGLHPKSKFLAVAVNTSSQSGLLPSETTAFFKREGVAPAFLILK